MTRTEMLNRLGLDEENFSNLLLKFRVFYASLTEQERAVVDRVLPNFKRTAGLFGGDITRDDLKTLLAPSPAASAPPAPGAPPPAPPPPPGAQPPTAGVAGAFGQNGINQIANGDGNGG